MATQLTKTIRTIEQSALLLLIGALLGACPKGEEATDAGRRRPDSGTPREDASTSEPEDAGADDDEAVDQPKDAGTADAQDSRVDMPDAKVDAATSDAGPKDAAADVYVPVDPIQPGTDAPTLSKLGYFSDTDLGHRILMQGRDPNGDVATYTIKFFKGSTPVFYDIDNDTDTPSVDRFSGKLESPDMEAGFFLLFEPTLELTEAVDTIKVFVTDEGGRNSTELTATRGATPTVTSTCDPNGFNRCNSTSVCAKSGANNVCTPIMTARNNACTAALTLQPPTTTSVRGSLRTFSLWDIPPSCGTDVTLQRDAVVKLKLASAAATVVLSTESAYTNFDTVLYLLDTGCKNAPTTCAEGTCYCSDDVPASGSMPRTAKSRLTLTNLAAGDHYIVIDSAPSSQMEGTDFELTVTVQ